jgi:hypothetical protein
LLLSDVVRNNFGILKDLNTLSVSQNILRVGQNVQDLVFNLLQLVLVLGSLNDKLFFLGFKLGVLESNNDTQELITKTFLGNHEVDQGNLGGDFWKIVWVSEFSGHDEGEVLVILHNGISDFDCPVVTLLHNLLLQKWLDGWVHVFLDIFHQEWIPHSNGNFQNL